MKLKPWTWRSSSPPPPGRRLVALGVAGALCALASVVFGGGMWAFRHRLWRPLGSAHGVASQNGSPPVVASPAPPPAVAPTPPPWPFPTDDRNAATGAVRPDGDWSPPELVFVPGGEVVVGGVGGRPAQKTTVPDAYLTAAEVTWAEYAAFVRAGGGAPPPAAVPTTPDAPVTNISQREAQAYCLWLGRRLNAVVRLPTEAEWNRAAAGESPRVYPWGDDWRPTAAACLESGTGVRPVKSFPAGRSPWGLYDMAGNVWEWTADLNEAGQAVIKGGAADESRDWLRIAAAQTAPPEHRDSHLGFRCLVEPSPGGRPPSTVRVRLHAPSSPPPALGLAFVKRLR